MTASSRSSRPPTPHRPDPRGTGLAPLMARVQDGDHDAFRDLYDHSVTVVHATALRTTRSPEHAAEVVQEVYVHAWQRARDFDLERGPVLGWLVMLTHRRAVDRVRTETSARLRDQRDFHRSDTSTPDVADLGVARHEAGRLRLAVRGLSEKQRTAVTLTYLQGYTVREAAGILGIPEGTVKTRTRDGVAALRDHLGAQAA